MLKYAYAPYRLEFNFRALTSRGALPFKDTFYLKVWEESEPERFGIGECALFRGLSKEDSPEFESRLIDFVRQFNREEHPDLSGYSSIRFGLETAVADYRNGCIHNPFPSDFVSGDKTITINGLVWMGTIEEMTRRAAEKIESGFKCIKFKVGGEDFEREFDLLRSIRDIFGSDILEIRLDANGAFTPGNAMERLERLAKLEIHSIEQPIAAGQWHEMADICEKSTVPVALDEELIGCSTKEYKNRMLKTINPEYIILKPSLCGGFGETGEWIDVAEENGIGWWVTSALESNIGLNAIAQWTAAKGVRMPQGLGTGGLFINNIPSPLTLHGDKLSYSTQGWRIPQLPWKCPE